PGIVDDMKAYRRWLDPSLREAYALEEAKGDDGDKRRQLHASLALLPVDPGQVDYLFQRLLTANPQELLVIRETLQPHADDVSARLWDVMQERTRPPGERLRAACALAAYAEDDPRWEGVSREVVKRLLGENSLEIAGWAEALRPACHHMLAPLAVILLEY